MQLFDTSYVVSADGTTLLSADGAIVAIVENGHVSYYELSSIIENVVTSCGRFMLDQSLIDEPPAAVRATLRGKADIPE